MRKLIWAQLTPKVRQESLQRPAIGAQAAIVTQVNAIKNELLAKGDEALRTITARLDGVALNALSLPQSAFADASTRLSAEFKTALQTAYDNIYRFHEAQKIAPLSIQTQEGVHCEVLTRAIERVGLYIPGGSAPLFSTVLMLAIPAKIAGCRRIVLATPPNVADEIIYAAQLCGIETIYTLGGAQAIFALGLGTPSVEKVDKIFGPGNSYVTEAKKQVSQMVNGAAIDMPAGPSEVLVIADEHANPDFVASDLLSQAEHGPDSQVILVTPSQPLADAVNDSIAAQLKILPRKATAEQALNSSVTIIAADLKEALAISNQYAPEHLIIQTENARELLPLVNHAGSVFLGAYSPESMGDYASGTNHVLPTYGYARTTSSLGLADFSKRMTVQELTQAGFCALAPAVSLLAEKELLDAHKMAVEIRLAALNKARGL